MALQNFYQVAPVASITASGGKYGGGITSGYQSTPYGANYNPTAPADASSAYWQQMTGTPQQAVSAGINPANMNFRNTQQPYELQRAYAPSGNIDPVSGQVMPSNQPTAQVGAWLNGGMGTGGQYGAPTRAQLQAGPGATGLAPTVGGAGSVASSTRTPYSQAAIDFLENTVSGGIEPIDRDNLSNLMSEGAIAGEAAAAQRLREAAAMGGASPQDPSFQAGLRGLASQRGGQVLEAERDANIAADEAKYDAMLRAADILSKYDRTDRYSSSFGGGGGGSRAGIDLGGAAQLLPQAYMDTGVWNGTRHSVSYPGLEPGESPIQFGSREVQGPTSTYSQERDARIAARQYVDNQYSQYRVGQAAQEGAGGAIGSVSGRDPYAQWNADTGSFQYNPMPPDPTGGFNQGNVQANPDWQDDAEHSMANQIYFYRAQLEQDPNNFLARSQLASLEDAYAAQFGRQLP